MKTINIFKISLSLALMGSIASCKEDTYNIIDPNGIPQASDYNIKVEVDQETNQYTLTLTDATGNSAMGVYPVWKIYTGNNPVISTRPVHKGIVINAGDYEVEMQVGNKNGVSDGVRTASFHIENTLVDFSPYVLFLTDNSSKTWQMAANEPSHLACGPSGTEGTEWWSASPYEKKDFGLYDNRMIFTDNGGKGTGLYTFDPGSSGTVYINTGISNLPPYSEYWQEADYCAPVDKQEDVPFTLSAEGNDLFLSFPAGTFMVYLPTVEQYDNPKWKINSANKNKIELTCDNGDIAWHYILQPEGADAGDRPFEGFKYDSEFNLWKDADIKLASTWFDDGSWSGSITQPEVEVTSEIIKLHTPANMGKDQWQGQVHINTGIAIESTKTYDFSMKLTAPVDCEITVKPHPEGDDNTFFVADKMKFEAGGSYYYFSDIPGFDTQNLVLTLDFAGYPDTDFEVTKIVLKDHANDDGTVLPGATPEQPGGDLNVSWVDLNSPDNLWNSATVTKITTYTAVGNDWSPGTDPTITEKENGYEVYYPDGAGGSQWQAQFALETDMSFDPEKLYDFRVTINPSCDLPGVTVKPTDFTDQSFWSADQHALDAFEDNVVALVAVQADMPDFKIVFDFAGVQPGATVVVKDILIQEHRDGGGSSPSVGWVDVNSEDNLWNAGKITDYFYFTADNDWGPISNPDLVENGNSFELSYSVGNGGSQWQGQFGLVTDLSFSADKKYDFQVTIYPTCDIPNATVKPTDYSDGNFWSDAQHALEAYEDNVISLTDVSADMPDFKIIFDFPGVPTGSKVTIKNIIIQEHK